jgi:hypothetical protein
MVAELVSVVLFALLGITFVALGAYAGALRALDVFYSEKDSIFLSEDAGPRNR